jgi:hypothetical protein
VKLKKNCCVKNAFFYCFIFGNLLERYGIINIVELSIHGAPALG